MWGRVKVEVGQRWGYLKATEEGVSLQNHDVVLPLTVIATSPEGAVTLRPASPQIAETFFPETLTTFKGKPRRARVGCPGQWVDDTLAKGSKGQYQVGDLLVHEAWNVWTQMHLHSDPKPGDLPFRVEKV